MFVLGRIEYPFLFSCLENSELNVFRNVNVEGEVLTFILTTVHAFFGTNLCKTVELT